MGAERDGQWEPRFRGGSTGPACHVREIVGETPDQPPSRRTNGKGKLYAGVVS